MAELTDIQKRIWNFIRKNVLEKGYPPTLRELGDKFEIASTNGVRYHLRILEREGYLKQPKGKRRGIRLTHPEGLSPYKSAESPFEIKSSGKTPSKDNVVTMPNPSLPTGLTYWWKALPIVGRVAAGAPVLAVENREDEIGVDQALFGGGPGVELFGLRISGESMIEAGIYDGDLAVVKKQQTARHGDIVVAVVNDDATVKRYLPEDHRIVLKAENPDYPSIVVTAEDRFQIAGVVVGLIRRTIR